MNPTFESERLAKDRSPCAVDTYVHVMPGMQSEAVELVVRSYSTARTTATTSVRRTSQTPDPDDTEPETPEDADETSEDER